MVLFSKVLKRTAFFLSWIFLTLSIIMGLLLTIFHIPFLLDFGSFVESARQVKQGNNPYTYDGDYVFYIDYEGEFEFSNIYERNLDIYNPNLNPPISILFFEPITNSRILNAAYIWRIFSFVLYAIIILILVMAYPKRSSIKILWAFSLAGLWQTIEVGQIYVPLWLLFCLAWIKAEKQDNILSGILLGAVIAIKPQFALLSIFLLIINYKKTALYSILTSTLISLIPLLKYGYGIYPQWIEATIQYKGHFLPGNSSFAGFFVRAGNQTIGEWLGVLLILAMLFYIYTKKPGFQKTSLAALLTILLAFPISWAGYTVFLLPWLFSQPEWSWRIKLSSGILVFPFMALIFLFPMNEFNFIFFGWIYGFALIALLIDLIVYQGKESYRSVF